RKEELMKDPVRRRAILILVFIFAPALAIGICILVFLA
ncbi:unnamed protein product, partial [marine sediment metagenome]